MSQGLETADRWALVDAIVEQSVDYDEQQQPLADALGRLMIAPWTGVPFAIGVLYGLWAFFTAVSGFLTDGYFLPAFNRYWLPFMQGVIPQDNTWLYFILVGDPAATHTPTAFGMLTSGLFLVVGVVLPAIVVLYLLLIVLEDSGYLPRLAVLVDTLFRRIGLHGYSIVPMVLSFGCNVPGVAATRNLNSPKQRFMTMTLLSIFIPCGAQLGIMLALLPQYVGYILAYLVIGFFVVGAVLHRLLPGSTPELVTDVPPLRPPRVGHSLSKLRMRVKGFLRTAIPFVLLGVGVINVLYLGGIIDRLSRAVGPVLTGWFGVPSEIVPALIAGFLRKDLAVAQLAAIELTTFELIMSVVIVSIYFPCAATFAMILKEGRTAGGVLKTMVGAVSVLLVTLFVWGGLLRLIGLLLGVSS